MCDVGVLVFEKVECFVVFVCCCVGMYYVCFVVVVCVVVGYCDDCCEVYLWCLWLLVVCEY